VNKNDKVMTQHFTKRFVDHRNVGLAAKTVSEFALHHGERGFDVATLVVVLQELRTLELKVVVHLLPRSAAVATMVRSERNKRRSAKGGDWDGWPGL